jgi:hypothetical protein
MRAVHANEGPIPRPNQETCIDQRAEQRITHVALETPEAAGLGGCQSKAGHLHEFALYSL